MNVPAFHDQNPGCTWRAMHLGVLPAGGNSYAWLAADVPPATWVLDLASGDGGVAGICAKRGCYAVALDASRGELDMCRAAEPNVLRVCAAAQALPFADASFDHVLCHMAWMLFDDLPQVANDVTRVLRPGGSFAAVLGGGPPADHADAIGAYVSALQDVLGNQQRVRLGSPLARTEAGWRTLFGARFTIPPFERAVLAMRLPVDAAWDCLADSYDLPPVTSQLPADLELRAAVKIRFLARVSPLRVADDHGIYADGVVPIDWVLWRARAISSATSG